MSFLSSLQSKKAQEFQSFLSDNKAMGNVNFLCDIMSHLNHLKLQPQGKNHTVADMYEAVKAFRSKLNLLEIDIHGRKLHFPRLHKHCEEKRNAGGFRGVVSSLSTNFKERFESSPKLSSDLLLFLRQLFPVSADSQRTAEARKLVPSVDEAALQREVLEMATHTHTHTHTHSTSAIYKFATFFFILKNAVRGSLPV